MGALTIAIAAATLISAFRVRLRSGRAKLSALYEVWAARPSFQQTKPPVLTSRAIYGCFVEAGSGCVRAAFFALVICQAVTSRSLTGRDCVRTLDEFLNGLIARIIRNAVVILPKSSQVCGAISLSTVRRFFRNLGRIGRRGVWHYNAKFPPL